MTVLIGWTGYASQSWAEDVLVLIMPSMQLDEPIG